MNKMFVIQHSFDGYLCKNYICVMCAGLWQCYRLLTVIKQLLGYCFRATCFSCQIRETGNHWESNPGPLLAYDTKLQPLALTCLRTQLTDDNECFGLAQVSITGNTSSSGEEPTLSGFSHLGASCLSCK